MKTLNKDDIRALKDKHRLELVMQETGEIFELDARNPDHWRSKTTPGLTVNIRRQMYEISKPGMNSEMGDVIAWLKRRYAWTFGQAVKFLQNRPRDPKRVTQPTQGAKSGKKRKQNQFQESDFVTITHEYTDPATGAKSYAIKYNNDIMDNLQRRALDAAGDWVIKYFTKSSDDLWRELEDHPHRFKKIIDFEIEKCASCESPFNWQDPETFAFACEEKKYLDIISDDKDAENMRTDEEIFADADFVICEKCLRAKYAPRYKALKLVWRSAHKREEAEDQEKKQRDQEAWIEAEREEERMNSEAALLP